MSFDARCFDLDDCKSDQHSPTIRTLTNSYGGHFFVGAKITEIPGFLGLGASTKRVTDINSTADLAYPCHGRVGTFSGVRRLS